MNIGAQQQLNELLEYSAEALDISEELDQRLTNSYLDLGEWFKRDNENRFTTDSEVYPQGSKRLGTVTAPVKPGDECDIDLVYRRDLKRASISQHELKESTGEQLRRYLLDRRARGQDVPTLDEGSRCWTLRYSGYHLDVLPALPDEGAAGNAVPATRDAIVITDKVLRRWQSSNPKAYAAWFRKRMEGALREGRVTMAKSAGVEVEEIPEDAVKTPLQRAVQLLKRHRDISYEGNPDDKPISIIITTLAALAYGNEGDVYSALRSIVGRMHQFIIREDGMARVPNPTNPDENFADKWETYPERAEQFIAWLGNVHTDLDAALGQQGIDKVATVLAKRFGHTIVEGAVRRYGGNKFAQRTTGTLRATSNTATLGTVGGIAVRGHTFFGDEE